MTKTTEIFVLVFSLPSLVLLNCALLAARTSIWTPEQKERKTYIECTWFWELLPYLEVVEKERLLLTAFFSRSFLCWLIRVMSPWRDHNTNHQVSNLSGNEEDLPLPLDIPLHSCTQLILFYFFSAEEEVIFFFCRCKKEPFIFPIWKKKVRKNTLSFLKGNILLLALLYVRRFFSSSNLKFSTWMDG